MKTLFIHQPFRFDIHPGCLPTIVPRNLLLLGACLESKGLPVKIHDMQIDELGPESIPPAVEDYGADLVGIAIHAAPYLPATKSCCQAVKARAPHLPIVTGGMFPSQYGEKVFDVIPEIDIVVLNEGEETIVDLVSAMAAGAPLDTVPGIIFRDRDRDGAVVRTAPRPMLDDLSRVPLPAYGLMDMARYRRPGVLPPFLEAQRGCSFSCKFCGVHFPNRGGLVRYREPTTVVEEIRLLHEVYRFDRFFFCDDTFTLNRRFAQRICEEIIAQGLESKVRWTAYTRADRIDPETARLLAAAGCTCLAMGVETGSHRDTLSINKRETVSDYHRGVQIVKDAGMDVHTLIIFGFPEVTHADIPMAARFLLDARPTMSQFFIFHPVPGTEPFGEPERHGLHFRFDKIEDWYKADFIEEPLSETPNLTREDIIKYFISYNLAFHSYESPGEDDALQRRLLRNAIPRKRREVVLLRTGSMALYSSPILPPGLQYADLHKNSRRLDDMQYEVLLCSNGDFTIEEIARRIAKLFDFAEDAALAYVVNALVRFEELQLIHDLPALREFAVLLAGAPAVRSTPPAAETAVEAAVMALAAAT